ncbi:MAG: hypothetical protein CV090_15950 [Nitrospira sp. WS238]|nr:hypothetical protein [Nitrospira sp. WS238]
MLRNSGYHMVGAMGMVLLLTSCSDTDYVMRPPAPEKLPSLENPIRGTADSVVNVPVQIDISAFLHAANDPNLIPKKFDHWRNLAKHPKGVDYKYYAERDDFTVEREAAHSVDGRESGLSLRNWWKDIDLSGVSLFVSAPLRYKVGARSQAQGAESWTQCGDGSGWPRQATLNGSIAMGMTPDYGVSASLRSVTVHPIEPCQLRISDVDLQQAVNSAIEDQVRGGLNSAVSHLNGLSVKSRAEDVWAALQNPIQLEPDTWLLLNLDKVRHTGFSKEGHVVTDTLQLTAHPVIVLGAEPPARSTALPQLVTDASSPDFRGVADVQDGYSEKRPGSEQFHVLADIQVDYSTLSKTLSNRLKGKRVANKGNFIRMTGAAISALGENQVLLRVDFTGDARGHVYLIGKPEINGLTRTVYLGGLRYDPATTHLLQTTAPDWLYHAPLLESITPEVVLGVTPKIDQLRDLLQTGLNRTLSPTVSMQGTVTSMQGIAVFADVDALHVRAMGDGALTVTGDGKP